MKATKSVIPAGVDLYIGSFPDTTRMKLEQLRDIIRAIAPEATEHISYQMPAYSLHGPMVYFAGYKNHIGFYPCASGIEVFKDEFSKYKWSKGAVQFPLDKPLPVTLIKKIVSYRRKENLQKALLKGKSAK
ncbi:MAG TPA: DUF1801 domain-containing protein [Ferruginibacter sp.]|nr:DUF1801 domain-containing protein [Ferruginibacter sp.]